MLSNNMSMPIKSVETAETAYHALVEQIQATIQECVFRSRQELIEGHWEVGKLIREYPTDAITDLLQGLAVDTSVSERTLWYSVQLFDKYPDLAKLPEGKNISWNKLITKYLPDSPSKEAKALHECPLCGNKHTYDSNKIK